MLFVLCVTLASTLSYFQNEGSPIDNLSANKRYLFFLFFIQKTMMHNAYLLPLQVRFLPNHHSAMTVKLLFEPQLVYFGLIIVSVVLLSADDRTYHFQTEDESECQM